MNARFLAPRSTIEITICRIFGNRSQCHNLHTGAWSGAREPKLPKISQGCTIGIMEKNKETIIIGFKVRIILEFYRDNGKENGNYGDYMDDMVIILVALAALHPDEHGSLKGLPEALPKPQKYVK